MFRKTASAYPTKTDMNFVHDDVARSNRRAIILFVIFMIFLFFFVQVAVIMPMNKIMQAESEYNQLNESYLKLQESTSNYQEVQAEYDEIVGSYLTDAEKACLNRPDILKMIEIDVIPFVPVKNITVSKDQISIMTDTTDLYTVSKIVHTLQNDAENAYATVITASASDTDDSLVTANFQITFASSTTDGQSTMTNTEGGECYVEQTLEQS